jgi:TetR/AcrR family transcriptional regulator
MTNQLEKAFERKEELLEAALDEFTRNSFEEASLNTIIQQAGISKGSFYYHFKNKEDLYIRLLKRAFDAKWRFIALKSSQISDSAAQTDLFEHIKIQARLGVEFAIAYPKYYRLGRMFSGELGRPIYEIGLKALEAESENKINQLVDRAMENGCIREEFSRDFVQRVLGFILMHFNEIFNSPEDGHLENMIANLDRFVNFLKYGFSRPS